MAFADPATEEPIEDPANRPLVRRGAMEQGHRRAQLHGVDAAEDVLRRTALGREHDRRALPKARPEDRVVEVRPCLVERRDGVDSRHLAPPQARDLREHEPHPVAALPAGPQLGDHAVIDPVLCSGRSARGRTPWPDCRAQSSREPRRRHRPVPDRRPDPVNVAFFELGRAFDYPDILRREPDEILRRFHAGGTACCSGGTC